MEPAKISTRKIKFEHTALLEIMKNLVQQVAPLSTEVNQIKATSQAVAAANVPAAASNQQPMYDLSQYYHEQKKTAPQYYKEPTAPTHW